jgi:[ribosomal protein S5]-alanine N-acetyltransferase
VANRSFALPQNHYTPPFERVEIRTDRLQLVLLTPDEVLAQIEGMVPADRAEVSEEWLAQARASTAADPWVHGFSMVDRLSGAVVGSCGFKGPPDAEGVVEIAYGVQPPYQGLGYATEAAWALVGFAFEAAQVRVVRAHTLPVDSASTHVLTKCGFRCLGDVIDPEDGPVWRWERSRESPV